MVLRTGYSIPNHCLWWLLQEQLNIVVVGVYSVSNSQVSPIVVFGGYTSEQLTSDIPLYG